jgi:regulatory protein
METENRARDLALRYLGRREATAYALRSYLRRKGFDSGACTKVVDSLIAIGAVDDLRWARIAIRDSLRARRGDRAIARKLQLKGIEAEPREVARWIQEERESLGLVSHEDAAAWAERRYGHLDWKEPRIRNRVLQGLIRRGFDYSVARRVVAKEGDVE